MLKKPIPFWIVAGGFALAGIGGCVNAVGLLGVRRQALSHMSGTVTNLGLLVADGNLAMLRYTACVVLAFFLGALVSGFVVRQSTLHAGRRYGVALVLESALLFLSVYFLRSDSRLGDYFAAMACGLQNGMATSYSGTVIRTTHVTGIITDLGIACGHLIHGQAVEWRRFMLYGVLLAGFVVGGCLGGLGFARFRYDTLLFPATLSGCAGLAYVVWKHFSDRRKPHGHHRNVEPTG